MKFTRGEYIHCTTPVFKTSMPTADTPKTLSNIFFHQEDNWTPFHGFIHLSWVTRAVSKHCKLITGNRVC